MYAYRLTHPVAQDAVEGVLGVFASMFDEISHRRAAVIDEASAMCMLSTFSSSVWVVMQGNYAHKVEDHSLQRHRSRNRVIKQAKIRIDEDMENQRVRLSCLFMYAA